MMYRMFCCICILGDFTLFAVDSFIGGNCDGNEMFVVWWDPNGKPRQT